MATSTSPPTTTRERALRDAAIHETATNKRSPETAPLFDVPERDVSNDPLAELVRSVRDALGRPEPDVSPWGQWVCETNWMRHKVWHPRTDADELWQCQVVATTAGISEGWIVYADGDVPDLPGVVTSLDEPVPRREAFAFAEALMSAMSQHHPSHDA